ncbi:MAG TPA: putative transporter small subunit [Paenalcaligenes sp.]|nr:putative transporter small subunit [Paenalcaligenes sp.]
MNWIVFYILVWPVISAGILALLIFSLVRDLRAAKREGREMV